MTQPLFDLLGRGQPPRGGLRDRVLLLRSVPVLRGVDDDGMTLLAEHAVRRSYRQGEVVDPGGEPPQAIRVVTEGRIRVTHAGRADVVVSRGQAFGVFVLMAEVRSERAVAEMDTVTLEVPAAAFRMALEENFSLLRGSLRIMGATLADSRQHLPADPANPPVVDVGEYFDRPRTLVERVLEMRKNLSTAINMDALADMARAMTEVRVPAGHLFWSCGDPPTHAIGVAYGRVRCTAADGQFMDIGRDFTLGVMDAWSGRRRSYTARAETPVIGHRIGAEDFLVLAENHVSVGLEMLKVTARMYLAGDTGPPPSPPT